MVRVTIVLGIIVYIVWVAIITHDAYTFIFGLIFGGYIALKYLELLSKGAMWAREEQDKLEESQKAEE